MLWDALIVAWVVLRIILSAFYTEAVQLSMTYIPVCYKRRCVSWKDIDMLLCGFSFHRGLLKCVCVSITYCAHTWRDFTQQRFTQYPFSSKYLLWHLWLHCLFVWVKLRKRSKNVDAYFQSEKSWNLTV